jgi:hypothetical protein
MAGNKKSNAMIIKADIRLAYCGIMVLVALNTQT